MSPLLPRFLNQINPFTFTAPLNNLPLLQDRQRRRVQGRPFPVRRLGTLQHPLLAGSVSPYPHTYIIHS